MLQGYKVLNLESNQFKPVKASLSKGKLSLNNALFQAIGFPFYYRLLFNKDLKRIVVEACEPLDEAAIKGIKNGQSYKIFTNQQLITLLSKWIPGYNHDKVYNLPVTVYDNFCLIDVSEATYSRALYKGAEKDVR